MCRFSTNPSTGTGLPTTRAHTGPTTAVETIFGESRDMSAATVLTGFGARHRRPPAAHSGSLRPFARRTGAMNRHRTTARGVSLLILTALLAAAVVASSGAAPKPGLIDGSPIVFPLIGDYAYGNNYGDARAQGRHAGIDIERVPWRTPSLPPRPARSSGGRPRRARAACSTSTARAARRTSTFT